jgi:ATP-dependent helicase/nuclease subunit A
MNFNTEQSKAIVGEEPLIVVSAGAGSGKTRVLTERYVRLCELKLQSELGYDVNTEIGAEAKEIVTLTFTEDAALEMRSRIRKRLLGKWQNAKKDYPRNPEEASDYWKRQIESLDTAIISTFHSFCQRMIQENLLEADIYPNFQVLDDVQSKLLKSEIFSEILEEAEQAQKWQALIKAIYKVSLKESLFSVYGKVREFEMGGTLHDTLQVETIVTAWRTKVNEDVAAFESEFNRFFRANTDISRLTAANKKLFNGLNSSFEKVLDREDLLKSLKNELQSLKNTVPTNLMAQNQELYQLLQTWLKVRDFVSYPLMESVLLDFENFLVTFDQRYQQRKREAAVMDFSDLQQKAIKLMNVPSIASYYSSMFKHFLVDEMQDTNQLQLRMIEKINPAYRFIVGDGKQSIYRFRGADVEIFNVLINEAKETDHFSFIDMNTNYRTCDSIIQFINGLFEQEQLMGIVSTENNHLYKTAYSPMTASRNDERSAENRVEYIKVTEEQAKSQHENEYVMIARRMVELEKGKFDIFDKDQEGWRPVEWRDMAVLLASRTNLTTLEMALKEYDIPYNVYGGLGFYERQEVVDFLSLLQWTNKPYEPLHMMAVLRGPLFGVTMDEFLEIQHGQGAEIHFADFIYERHFRQLDSLELQTKLENFCQLAEKWIPFHWTASNQKQLVLLFEDSGLKKVLLLQKNNLMKIKNVEKLMETMTNLPVVSMDEMLEKISILADLSKKEGDAEVELTGGNFVHIMTVHGSKGLEFPVVFVPNLSKGIPAEKLPVRYDVQEGLSVTFTAEDEEDLLAEPIKITSPNFESIHTLSSDQAVEESKRLFYVALTRARDLLILSSKDKGKKNTWSYWLEEAISNSEQLEKLVLVKEGIPEQKVIQEYKEIYEGPKVKLVRSIPISFSVSEVMSYLSDPDSFLEKHLLKLDEAWLVEPETTDEFIIDEKLAADEIQHQVDPRTLGTLVHRICELLDKGYTESDAYREAFTTIMEKDVYLNKVKPLIQSYLNKDFGQPLENEWEFVLDIEGIQIIGEIDKVVRKETRLEVLDLKTNRIKDNVEELIDYYKPQLYLYKLAYENQKQVTIDKMSLVFLRDEGQGVYEVTYEPSFEDQLKKAIQQMANLKREVQFIG